ncbi:MAG: hypothetical protein HQK91_02615 [Nitrospirae bacterium]|nr:hypothetical protein [Nitrospirota bacterium]MBF0540328.1 hypothetical protein [Nitrospirota bacterium]
MNLENINSNVKYFGSNTDNDYNEDKYSMGGIKGAGMIDETNITIIKDKDNILAEIKPQKAFFVVDENNNVFVKVVSPDGKCVEQMQPEEYMKMSDDMDSSGISLFHVEA